MWLSESGHERGYVVSPQTIYELSRDWYAGRMDEDWRPPGADQAEAMFRRHGLTGEFWTLSS